MARMSAQELVQRYEALESERRNLDGQLELLERFVLPGKGRFFEEGLDQEESINWRHREIYDGTANNAAVQLSANVHGALTSPATEWFELRFRDDELNDSREASAWLEECAKRMRASYTDSNFNVEVSEYYQDAVGFGTSVMFHGEQDGPATQWNGHRFKAEMLRFCYFEEDSDGNPTSVFVKRSYTPMQLALKFGRDRLPASIAAKLDSPESAVSDKASDVIYTVYRDETVNVDTSTILPVSQRPYVGRWVAVEGREWLGDEQGFYELPSYVLRWGRTAGSKYGHSPGIIALGDILTLQEMVEMVRTSTEKVVDPPMKYMLRGVIGDVELQGGGLTAVKRMDGIEPMMPPGAYRVEAGWQDISDLRSRIERYFFIDQLHLKESPQMTATEVQVRYEMMQRLLGPTLGRIQSDFLDPLVQRSFWMMSRKGAFPQMPEEVQASNAELDIDYVGPLARAQKMASVDGITRWLAIIGQMAQVKPEVLDVPDDDAIAKYVGEVLGVPAKLYKSDAEIDAKRKERKAQIEQAQKLAQAEQASVAAKNIGQSGLVDEMGGAGMQGPPVEQPPDVGTVPPETVQ